MTTIAAIARDGDVHMAADSMANIWDRPVIGGVPKLIRRPAQGGGEVLFGCSGDAAISALIRYGLHLDAVPGPADDPQPFADTVAQAVTELARDTGLLENGRMSATVLMGWHGQLWTLTHGIAVRHPDGIAAVGSGEGPAMGAMYALLSPTVDPARTVVAAARIAITLDRHSDGPVVVAELTEWDSLPPARPAEERGGPGPAPTASAGAP